MKQQLLFCALLLTQCIATEPTIAGLIGGVSDDTSPSSQYVGVIAPDGVLTSVFLSGGEILSVAVNDSGLGLIGGTQDTNLLYGAFLSSPNAIQPIPFPSTPNSSIESVAINGSNLGLVGGGTNGFNAYAAFVTQTSVTPISNLPTSPSFIRTVALNNSGQGIIGGFLNFLPYVALVSPSSSTATQVPMSTITTSINSVIINNSGLGLVGGFDPSEPAAFIVNGTAVPISVGLPNIFIEGVALNDSGLGLIVGTGFVDPFAAFVSLGTSPQPISNLPPGGTISAASINSFGKALIGGVTGQNEPYAALVSPGEIPQVVLVGVSDGFIRSVAINNFNQGLICGTQVNFNTPFAALVSPEGVLTIFDVGFAHGDLRSVAVNAFLLSEIPTEGLKGNNLIFANYINQNAPHDAFYFVPAIVDGSLAQALESAAPTRNMISFNTVLQNSFYLTTNLSAHLRNQRLIQARPPISGNKKNTAQLDLEETEEEFLAGRWFQKSKKQTPPCKPKTMTLWFDAIGALAYQKPQHQTPGFNPETIGGTLAFDAKVTQTMTVGGGASYFFTHVHEKKGQGKSNIQQEDLFLYGSWVPNNFYIDLGLWGGLFQTRQTRDIQMTGFSFQSRSKPHGWQLVPHAELGWIGAVYRTKNAEILWNLLGMLDWANGWQSKYSEKGNGPFNAHQKSRYGSLLRSEVGLRFSETMFFPTWNLIFQEKGSFVNIESFKAGHMQAFLVGSPGSFTLQTLTNAQNLGVAQVSITAAPYNSSWPSSMLMYQGEFSSGYQSHELDLEFSWNF